MIACLAEWNIIGLGAIPTESFLRLPVSNMRRPRAPVSRSQRLFWIVSILVVVSMAIGLIVSFTPQTPRGVETPTPTAPVILTPPRPPTPS